MDMKMANIIERLRQRDERYEAAKKNRKVNFEDAQSKPQPQQQQPKQQLPSTITDFESQFEELCIFKAEQIKKRAEEWPNEQMPRPDFYKNIFDGIRSHYLDDVLIKFGKICFKCPLIVLSCFSKKFNECDDSMTLHLSDYNIKPTCFSNICRWMMTEALNGQSGVAVIPHDAVLEMLSAAKILKISHLEDQCWYFLQKTARCNEKLAFELYKTTDFNMKEIQHMMLSRICKYFLTLVATEDFLKLNKTEVCTLLSLNTLGVNSEIEVFYAAVLWLNSQWNERKGETVKKVMKCVRFNLMPSWFLVSLNESTGCEAVDRIVQEPFVANLITEGIIYTANQLSTTTEKNYDKHHLQLKHSPLVQRRWLYDKSCLYHFTPQADTMEYVTFKMFTDYLNNLCQYGEDYWRTFNYAEADHCTKIWRSRPIIKDPKNKC